jgi:diguanylate cyclase (GGDEF)-like protein
MTTIKPAAPSGAGGPDVLDIDTLVVIEKVQLLYRQSLHAVFFSIVAASFWVAMMWSVASRNALVMWIVAMLVVSVIRLALFFAYRRYRPEGRVVLAWRAPYMLSLFLSAAVWGSSVLITPAEPLVYLCITYVFMIGLAGAALPAYGVFMHMAVGTIGALLIPVLIVLFARGETITVLLAVSGLWFFVTSLRALAVHNGSVTQSFRLAHELRAANLETMRLADTDGLTGLFNRRAFRNAAGALLELAAREQRPATMMLIDIDNFKRINDRHGHSAGDAALLRVSATLTWHLRSSDLCARLGGDEFAVLLPNTTETTAREVADKLCVALQAHEADPFDIGAISLSVGLAEGIEAVEPLLHRADAAMYDAKRSGKGRVVVAPPAVQ